MTVGFIDGYGYSNRGRGTDYNSDRDEGKRYGISMSSFYKIDENGNRVFDIEGYLNAIDEAKAKNAENTEAEAGQTDSFQRTSDVNGSSKKATQETKIAQETIDEEYEEAVEGYYNSFYNADLNQEASKDAEQAWDEVHEKEKDLTKIGLTSATIIAGVSDFVNLIGKAVAATNTIMETKEKEKEETSITLETEAESDDTSDNTYAYNPFMASAYETSDIEEEEQIAA